MMVVTLLTYTVYNVCVVSLIHNSPINEGSWSIAILSLHTLHNTHVCIDS